MTRVASSATGPLVRARMAPRVAIAALLGLVLGCGGTAPATEPCPVEPAIAPNVLGVLVADQAEPAQVVSGPMLGYNTHREVAVWAATDGPASVRVRYWPEGAPEAAQLTDWDATESTDDDTHLVRVTLLEPGTAYAYALVVDGEDAEFDVPMRFETQPLWRWNSRPPVPPDLRIALGSCTYINDPPYDRAGSPYGGGYEIFDAVAATAPDAMLWLGDNVYLREADWGSRASMAYRYAHDRALPELQTLLASTHHYAIWDDHDFGPNDSDRSFEFQGESLDLFRAYWANPSYGLPSNPGVYTRFVWGDVEFFLLDDRMYRAANDAPDSDSVDKPYLGETQLAWLLDGLTSSTATFKVVVNGNQVINDHSPYEGYHQFATERSRLLDGIAERAIDGVLFVSGDRHHTELLRVDRSGTYPLYEFTSSPLTSGVGDARHELDNPVRVPGTLVNDQRSFGLIDVSGPWEDRTLTLSARGADGTLLWEHQVHERELVTSSD